GFRKAPFTCAHLPGKVNLVALGAVYILGFTLYSLWMARLETWLAGAPGIAALFLVAVASSCACLSRWETAPAASLAKLDFEDPGDPVVRTLDLIHVREEERLVCSKFRESPSITAIRRWSMM